MTRCVLKQCKYSRYAAYKKDMKSLHLFRFPKNIEKREQWRRALAIETGDTLENARVCQLHFSGDSFDLEKSPFCVHLKKNAVPIGIVAEASSPSQVSQPSENCRKPADVSVTSKPEVRSVEPIPETSLQQPDGYLPEQTPSSSESSGITGKTTSTDMLIDATSSTSRQTEDSKNRPTKRRNSFGRDYCRMCLEPIAARNQMVPLTLMDINFPTKSASFKQKKEMETYRITDMIQVVMPDFDFDAAYNPIVCHKCVIRLESAYNFITGCRENEEIIQLYKSKYCPDAELVFCEDVAQNKKPLLVERSSPRKKRKTSKEHVSTDSVSDSLPGQSGSQLEQSGNTGDNSQAERFEVVYTSSAGQENLAPETSLELRSSIKCETEDYDVCEADSHFMIQPEEVSCIVKEEIVVKEEVSCDFTDTSNNERVAQMDMDYHVKEEDYLQRDAPSISNIEGYHINTSQFSPTNQMSQIFNRPKT